jgi:hypothetical protein
MTDFIMSKLRGRKRLEDEPMSFETDIENLCKTDQVMHFLEYEIETYRGLVPVILKEANIEDTNGLDRLRSQYLRSITDVGSSRISLNKKVEDFLLCREECRRGASRDKLSLEQRIMRSKSEIRESLETHDRLVAVHNDILEVLRPLINQIKLKKVLADRTDPEQAAQISNMTITVGGLEETRKPTASYYSIEEIKRMIEG